MDHPRWHRALLLHQQSRNDLAEGELRQLLGEAPNYAPAHALLARILVERERYDEATQAAMMAVHLAPDDAFAYQSLAFVMLRRRRYRDAEQAIQEAINVAPEWPTNYALLSQIHFAERRWQEALAAADKGLSLDAEDSDCANLKAMALRQLGRSQEAEAIVSAALAQNPEDALSHSNQGWTLLQQGLHQKALEHFQEALRLDPTDEHARAGIVEALKARNIFYRWMLGWFFWMSRLDRRVALAIIVGGYFGSQLLNNLAVQQPALAPFVVPVIVAYVAFALMTWVCVPLANLLLRFNRYGRLALSREQIAASNLVGAAALGAIGFTIAGFAIDEILLKAALICGFMLPSLASIYNCERGWPRYVMAAIAAALGCFGGAAIACLLVVLCGDWFSVEVVKLAAAIFLKTNSLYLPFAVISQFVANGLVAARVRR